MSELVDGLVMMAVMGGSLVAQGMAKLAVQHYDTRRWRRISDALSTEPLTPLARIAPGPVQLEGLARPRRRRLVAPISRREVLGYRLIGVIEPGIGRKSRRKIIDVVALADFDLCAPVPADDARARVAADRDGPAPLLIVWPPARYQLRFAQLARDVQEMILAYHPELDRDGLEQHWSIFWSEYALLAEQPVYVVGDALQQIAADGRPGSYRRAPTIWIVRGREPDPLEIAPRALSRLLVASAPRESFLAVLPHLRFEWSD